jgi:hypothetical protein
MGHRHRCNEAGVTHAHGHGREQSVREALVPGLQSQRIDAALGLCRGIEFRTEWCSQHELSTRTFSSGDSRLPESDSPGLGNKIELAQVLDLGPRGFEKFGAAVNHEREALGPADGAVEPVGVKTEFRAAGGLTVSPNFRFSLTKRLP